MLSKLLKRFRPAPQSTTPAVTSGPPPVSLIHPSPTSVDWGKKLEEARGDDLALLELAQKAPVHALRLAALQSITQTTVLRQALQTFRGRDKALYRAAQTALDTQRQQQESQATAAILIQDIQSLLQQAAHAPLPANRLVELDHRWQKLDTRWLDPSQASTFSSLYAALQQQTREQLERHRESLQNQKKQAEEAAMRKAEQDTAQKAEQEAEKLRAAEAAAQAQQQAAEARQQAREQAHRLSKQAQIQIAAMESIESALQEGHLTEAEQALSRLQAEISETSEATATSGPIDKSLHNRLQAAQTEIQRLKAWQNWGGFQARESLIQEAETLAREFATKGDAPSRPLSPDQSKQLSQTLARFRKQWKQLDQAGSPSSSALWQRFDTALQTAWMPIAHQKEQLARHRQENLQSRLALLASLEQFPLFQPASSESSSPEIDWRALLQALSAFRTGWRKLGPIEHTVPHEEKDALHQRLTQALARLENPLDAARQEVRRTRSALIEAARTLIESPQKDSLDRVRELQNTWRQQAQSRAYPPLPHKEEAAQWEAFKAATDAIFAQRNAQRQAHQAEQRAHQSEREKLIAELDALAGPEGPTDIAVLNHQLKTLDARWRDAAPLHGALSNRLEATWQSAHTRLRQHREQLIQKNWQMLCDVLLQQLDQGAEMAHPPSLPEVLPSHWKEALAQQHNRPPQSVSPEKQILLDEILLQAEVTFDLPSPPEFQAARQQHRLQTMKQALEHRHAKTCDPMNLIADLLRHPAATPSQRERKRTLFNALRDRPSLLP